MVSDILRNTKDTSTLGLNPCSNGIWSLTGLGALIGLGCKSLNPCSNGIWSLTGIIMAFNNDKEVS